MDTEKLSVKKVKKRTLFADQAKNNESGIALVIVLGILTLMAVMGTSFTVDMRLEQKAAQNYNYDVKARMLAKAGVEKAIAALRKYASEYAAFQYADSYDDNGPVSERFSEYSPSVPTRWRAAIDITIGNVTGSVTTYVIDCASQIYINDDNAETILNNLGSVIGVSVANVGTVLDGARPAYGGFITKGQLRNNVLSESDYELIKDYITVKSWINQETNRAPININTAGNDVLEALMTVLATTPATLAADIVTERNSAVFETWPDFRSYIEGLPPGVVAGDVAAILNNCDSNDNILATTAEVCFNSGGYFEIESIGTVYAPGSTKVMAQKKIKTNVKIFEIWHDATYSDFFNNTRNGLTVDESVLNLGQIYAADTGIYSNDGTNLTNWTISGAEVAANEFAPEVTTGTQTTNNVIQIAGSSGTAYLDVIYDQTKIIYAAARLYVSDSGSGIRFYLSDGTNEGPDITVTGSAIQYGSGPTPFNTPIVYTPGDWVQVEILADTNTRKYNVFIDGTLREKSGGGEEIDFNAAPAYLDRINIANLDASVTVYFDDVQIRCGGPMINSYTSPETVYSWGTLSWTESDQALTGSNEIKFHLSTDGSTWRGPDGTTVPGGFYSTPEYGMISDLNQNAATTFYCYPNGSVIPTSYDSSNRLDYAVVLATFDPLIEAAKLYDVTITYLPETQIMSWEEVSQ